MIRALALAALAVAFVVPAPAAHAGAPGDEQPKGPGAARVLVLSLPATRWADLPLDRMPHLRTLLDRSARASLTVRGAELQPTLADSAATISAGGRARASVARPPCATTHTLADGALPCPAMPAVVRENARARYDAEAGLLGATLAAARIPTAVIADGVMPGGAPADAVASTAPLALATPAGSVDAGASGPALTAPDPASPLGVAIDVERYGAAFRTVWQQQRAVVLLEDSDLARYAAEIAPTRQRDPAQEVTVYARLDALVGAVLPAVDLTRDVVLVVGPTHPPGDAQLTVAALVGPGVDTRSLRSATTRRTGIVSLIDVAPTVLDRLGVERPPAMEGAPWEVAGGVRSLSSSRRALVDDNEDAVLRDVLVQPVVYAYAITGAALTALGLLALRLRHRGLLVVVEVLALALLAFPAVGLLAQLAPFRDWGAIAWAVVTVAVSLVVGGIVAILRGARPVLGVLAVVGGVIALDAITGSHLHYANPWGYGPTIASRYGGLGNLTAALLAASVLLLGAALASQRATRGWAMALLAAALIIDATPFWGADIGGLLSLAPAFAIAAWIWSGRRLRPRLLIVAGLGTVALLTIATLVDLRRPRDRRTHLGRLVQSMRDNGWGRLGVVIRRKLDANIDQLLHSVWTWTVPLMLVLLVLLVHEARRDGTARRWAGARGALIGLIVAGGLGGLLNDSGIAVPGTMLVVLLAAALVIVSRNRRGALEPVGPA